MNDANPKPGIACISFLGVAQILVWGGSFFLMAVLADPVVKDTGWPGAWVYGALSIAILISGLLAPMMSRLIVRFGGRRILASSGWIIGAGLVLVAISSHLPIFILGWVVVGVGMTAGLYEALFATLGQLFGGQARNAIIGVTLFGGFSTTLTWPAVGAMLEYMGWRNTCLLYAAVLALSIWPLTAAALPSRKPVTVLAGGSSATGPLVEARLFRLMTLIFALGAILMTVMSVHLLGLLQGIGYSLAAAIGLSALVGPCQVGARVLDILSRRSDAVRTNTLSGLATALGFIVVALAPQAAVMGIALYGIGNGLRSIARGTLPLMVWNAADYPLVVGRMARPALLCQAATPLLGGYLMEWIGTRGTLYILCGVATLNALLVLLLRRELRRRQQ
ncbi:MFS transporter [Pseudomonas sp. MOB-449]|nr:MFS transporter [Pseudomonas sp. MOB-449]